MKIALNICTLVAKIPELVGDSITKFTRARQLGHLQRTSKRSKIKAAIFKKPQQFFGINENMILTFMTIQNFKAKVRAAVDMLTAKNRTTVECMVIDFENERILRGEFILD